MIRKIIEGKLRHNREKLEHFKKKGPLRAIRDYEIKVHLLEDILEDADEANECQQMGSNCNIQHVGNSEAAVDCVTCKHGDKMPDENPCFDCIGCNNWEQDTDC